MLFVCGKGQQVRERAILDSSIFLLTIVVVSQDHLLEAILWFRAT